MSPSSSACISSDVGGLSFEVPRSSSLKYLNPWSPFRLWLLYSSIYLDTWGKEYPEMTRWITWMPNIFLPALPLPDDHGQLFWTDVSCSCILSWQRKPECFSINHRLKIAGSPLGARASKLTETRAAGIGSANSISRSLEVGISGDTPASTLWFETCGFFLLETSTIKWSLTWNVLRHGTPSF